MPRIFWLLLCCWNVLGCASTKAVVREEAPAVFLPAELLQWQQWDDAQPRETGRAIYFVEAASAIDVEEVMARRPPRRGGRGGSGGQPTAPLLNPRPTREELAARRQQSEELRALQWARARYPHALQEARSRYPDHQGYQEHHLVPIYLGGPRNGTTYRLHAAYHQAITQEFRRLWSYGRGELPMPAELQGLLVEVFSKYPIPQLIGLTP